MKINPLIAKSPEDLQKIEFKKMKAIIKKELKRLQKNTSKDKPTQCIIIGEHNYPDKPGMALPLFGKWKGKFKDYAKKEVVKDPNGAIGTVYFDGIDESGQKRVQIQLAKGKGKNKVNKLERTLKKLIPQAAYNVIFSEITEEALEALDKKLDEEPEVEENFEAADMSDQGEIDVKDEGLDLKKLLASNLTEISNTLADVKANVIPKIKIKTLNREDVDKVENLLDLCQEWQEMYDEASVFDWAKASFLVSRAKVELMQQQIESLMPYMKVYIKEAADQETPVSVTTGANHNASSNTQSNTNTSEQNENVNNQPVQNNVAPEKTYNTAYQAQEIAKEMHKQDYFQPGHAFIPFTGKSGKKYKKGDKIEPGDGNPTWCNQFAYELSDKVLGEANPFNMLPMGEGWSNANVLTEFMDKADGVLVDKITGEGRYAKAWEQINKGKMVYFCHNNIGGIGHVATGAPTKTLKKNSKINDMVGNVTQAGSYVGEKYIDEIWGTKALGELGIYVGRFQEPLPGNAKPDPNLHLAIYDKITHPIGQGKILGSVATIKGYKPSELQDIVASIRTVQQLLQNAGQNVKVDGKAGDSTVTAIKNVQQQLGIVQSGYIEYNDATWNHLWNLSKGKVATALAATTSQEGNNENPQPQNTALKPEDIKFQMKGTSTALSAKSEQVLREILAAAGEPNAVIVNSLRSDEQQASVMLMNLKAYGAAFNRNQYKDKAAAGIVVDAYERAVAAGKSEQEILGAILAAVKQVGASKLSDHCNASNPAIDIHPSSIQNKSNFEKIIKADSRVTVICPPKDTSYHIIVK